MVRQVGLRDRWATTDLAVCVVSETPVADTVLNECLGTEERGVHLFGTLARGYCWYFPKRGYVNIGMGATLGIKNATEVYHNFVAYLRKKRLIPTAERLTLRPPKAHPVPVGGGMQKTYTDKILVVGDAAGFVSPLSGEGLYYGIKSGILAAETITAYLAEERALATYQEAWQTSFGYDLANYALPLRKLVFNAPERIERFVKMIAADPKFGLTVAEMLMGLITYKETKRRLLKRGLWSLIKSLRVRSGENRKPNPFGAVTNIID